MRKLLLVFLSWLALCAFHPLGAGIPCGVFVNGSTIGDTACPTTPTRVIASTGSGNFQFSGSTTGCTNGNGVLSQTGIPSLTCAGLVQVCGTANGPAGLRGVQILPNTFLNLFDFSGDVFQGTGICSVPAGYFLDVATGFYSAQASIDAATAGDTLTWRAAPNPITAWTRQGTANINKNNLTINQVAFGGNPYVAGLTLEPVLGNSTVELNANGLTYNGGTILGTLRVLLGAQNNTISNMTVGCSPAAAPGIGGGSGASCFLTGHSNGITTLTSLVVYGGGDSTGGGQNHNVYIGTDTVAANTDNSCYSISGLTSLNSQFAGWTAKLRPPCTNGGQGLLTNSIIGCTQHGNVNGLGCNQNGVIDFSCGGNHKVTHSVIEAGDGQAIYNNASIYLMKFGEELATNCPLGAPITHAIVFDFDIFIEDNVTDTGTTVCLIRQSVSSSTCDLPAGATCIITNSQIISNTAAMGVPITISPCTNGTGNTFYASRAAANAASAPGWTNGLTYTVPHMPGDITSDQVYPCCAFPYLPPHL